MPIQSRTGLVAALALCATLAVVAVVAVAASGGRPEFVVRDPGEMIYRVPGSNTFHFANCPYFSASMSELTGGQRAGIWHGLKSLHPCPWCASVHEGRLGYWRQGGKLVHAPDAPEGVAQAQ